MNKGVIVSLCDLTGAMVAPWVESGYDAVLVDPQHEHYTITRMTSGATVERIPQTILGQRKGLEKYCEAGALSLLRASRPALTCQSQALDGSRQKPSRTSTFRQRPP